MKRLTLTPEHVLATDTSFPEDNLAFQIYYRVFAKGGEDALPPIIVGTINSPGEWIARLELKYTEWVERDPDFVSLRRREYNIAFKKLRDIPHFILDGNHRALAAALNRQAFTALEIESDRDLNEIERMVSNGEILSFPHMVRNVKELEGEFIKYALNLSDVPPKHGLNASKKIEIAPLLTVATRAYELYANERIPSYMRKAYAARKPGGPRLLPSHPRLSW